MKRYIFNVKERNTGTVTVWADNEDEARELAESGEGTLDIDDGELIVGELVAEDPWNEDANLARYANCRIEFLDTHEECDVTIKLSTEIDEDEDERIFYYCESLNDLQSLTVEGAEDFVIREIYSYEY